MTERFLEVSQEAGAALFAQVLTGEKWALLRRLKFQRELKDDPET
jgi:hypothetical protein